METILIYEKKRLSVPIFIHCDITHLPQTFPEKDERDTKQPQCNSLQGEEQGFSVNLEELGKEKCIGYSKYLLTQHCP